MSDLSQEQADFFLSIDKSRVDETTWLLPGPGDKINIPLISFEYKEEFLLDISRSRIVLQKATYQTRAKQIHPIARIDLGGQPHRNPDDSEIGSPHLHVFREGFGLRWAFALDPKLFLTPNELVPTLYDFMAYCNIVDAPDFQVSLF